MVGRAQGCWLSSLSARRAWIEIRISVASNFEHPKSLSARRAWIEICGGAFARLLALVALRKESVDRNYIIKITDNRPAASLSARRAWIEILSAVDTELLILCRSPQGERG